MAKLLIVDDEIDVREFAANLFRKRKIDVDTASSGEEALEKILKAVPELVLLDIKMAGIDGIETLQRIKEINKNIKVIMVTGTKAEEGATFLKCHESGAFDYIHKPLDLAELERVVMNSLTKQQPEE